MTSLACSALATTGPGALLRRGTHGCAPFSQHSAYNIVSPMHNATLHTGFITPCQSAGGSGASVREQQETRRRGSSTWSRRCTGGGGDALVEQEMHWCPMVSKQHRPLWRILVRCMRMRGCFYLLAVQLSVAVWHPCSFSPVTGNYWGECFSLT